MSALPEIENSDIFLLHLEAQAEGGVETFLAMFEKLRENADHERAPIETGPVANSVSLRLGPTASMSISKFKDDVPFVGSIHVIIGGIGNLTILVDR